MPRQSNTRTEEEEEEDMIVTKAQEEDTSVDLTVSSAGDAASPTSSERLARVGFSSVHIRSFNRIAGDHPDVRNGGPPLSIGWDFVEQQAMDVDAYEQQKEEAKANSKTPWMLGLRRLTSGRRRDILRMEFDVPLEDIEAAEEEVERVKKQRAQTNKQKKLSARTEEMMQSAKRKLQRTLHPPAVRDEARLSAAPSSKIVYLHTLKKPRKPQPPQAPPAMMSPTPMSLRVMPMPRPMAVEVSV